MHNIRIIAAVSLQKPIGAFTVLMQVVLESSTVAVRSEVQYFFKAETMGVVIEICISAKYPRGSP